MWYVYTYALSLACVNVVQVTESCAVYIQIYTLRITMDPKYTRVY